MADAASADKGKSKRQTDAVKNWTVVIKWRDVELLPLRLDGPEARERFNNDGEVRCECGGLVVAEHTRVKRHLIGTECIATRAAKTNMKPVTAFVAKVSADETKRKKQAALLAVTMCALVSLGVSPAKIETTDFGNVVRALRVVELPEVGAIAPAATIRTSHIVSTTELMTEHIASALHDVPFSIIVDGATTPFANGDSMMNVLASSAHCDKAFLIGCFVKDGGTNAEALRDYVLEALSRHSLSLANVVAFAADGASVNGAAARVSRASL